MDLAGLPRGLTAANSGSGEQRRKQPSSLPFDQLPPAKRHMAAYSGHNHLPT